MEGEKKKTVTLPSAATQSEVLKRKRSVSDALIISPARQLSPSPAPRALRLRKKVVRFETGKDN